MITPGQRHESTQVAAVLDGIRVSQPGERGRPRKHLAHLIVHKGYSYPACRQLLRRRGIPHIIPERCDQLERKMRRPGQPLGFGAATYRRYDVIQRCVNKFKRWRGIATRYEKRAVNYRTMVVIATLMIWLTLQITGRALGSGGIYGPAIDQICCRHVLHRQPKRFEEGDLFRRFPAWFRPGHDFPYLRKDPTRGDDVPGFL